MTKKMTDLSVHKLTELGFHHDRDTKGLYIQVAPAVGGGVTPSYVLRYRSPETGKDRAMGLGSCLDRSLGNAREAAREARELLLRDTDPLEERERKRRARESAAAKSKTFAEVARDYIELHRHEWTNRKHHAQWKQLIHQTAKISDRLVADIDTNDIVDVLKSLWAETPTTASRLRGRLESILDYATAVKLRSGENPARWKGNLKTVFSPAHKVKPTSNHEAMPYAEVSEFMKRLRSIDSITARALEWTILTASRTGEVLGAKWGEIDPVKRLWTVPGGPHGRMKNKQMKNHIVPLSKRAMDIFDALPRQGEFMFAGLREGTHLGEPSMLQFLKRLGVTSTVHGFRSSFSDWTGECTNFDPETREFALAHGITDKTEAAYRRGTSVEKRRKLMQAWCDYCTHPRQQAVVLAMRREA
jgi:integrase